MHDHIREVHDDPLALEGAIHKDGPQPMLLTHLHDDLIPHGAELG